MILVVQNGGRTYTADVWKQDKFILLANSNIDYVQLWTNLHGSVNSPLATYSVDSNHQVYIDMTDYVRTYPSVQTITVYDPSSTASVVNVSVKGLINPESVQIPYFRHQGYFANLVPPSAMYASGQLQTECWNIGNLYWKVGSGSTYTLVTNNAISCNLEGETEFEIARKVGGIYVPFFNYTLLPLSCDARYAMVRWVSFTGKVRQHTLEVLKHEIAARDNYSLLNIAEDYDEVKGREDGFTLHLEGLSIYDYWYYSDIITSSKVEMSFDGTTWKRVQVLTKNVTIPDGETGFNGKLDIKVNYAKYDAVAM